MYVSDRLSGTDYDPIQQGSLLSGSMLADIARQKFPQQHEFASLWRYHLRGPPVMLIPLIPLIPLNLPIPED